MEEIDQIVNDLLKQEVVGFPTETIYGLAVVYDSLPAYEKLVQIKGRDFNKPMSVMLSDPSHIQKLAYLNEKQKRVADYFFPGPLTIILDAKDNLPRHVNANKATVGIRIPNHKTALEILKKVKTPLLVTSANIAFQKPLVSWIDVENEFGQQLACYVKEDASNFIASTVVDLTGKEPVVVRQGSINLEKIKEIWEAVK